MSEKTAPPRNKREHCWKVRDEFFRCLDTQPSASCQDEKTCRDLREMLFTACPESWATHFQQKYFNERRKSAEMARLGAKDIKTAMADGDIRSS